MSEIKRINIRMGQELHDWFEVKADQLGVPTSALMIIAMNEYRKMQVSSESLPMLNSYMQIMQKDGSFNVLGSASEALLDGEKSDVIA